MLVIRMLSISMSTVVQRYTLFYDRHYIRCASLLGKPQGIVIQYFRDFEDLRSHPVLDFKPVVNGIQNRIVQPLDQRNRNDRTVNLIVRIQRIEPYSFSTRNVFNEECGICRCPEGTVHRGNIRNAIDVIQRVRKIGIVLPAVQNIAPGFIFHVDI